MKTSIGGDRLGSGNNKTLALRNYERSSHDLGYTWRSSMSSGTLVPFMSMVALPGDTFEIKLDCDVKTLPTLGPLFGSYKVQLDVFECPVRLYQGKLHMNMLNIGMDMSAIKLPQMRMGMDPYYPELGTNQQIHPSSIYKYLGISGIGNNDSARYRDFNALPYLSYWDIYKQYYANKQEEIGVVIHSQGNPNGYALEQFDILVQEYDTADVTYNMLSGPQDIDLSIGSGNVGYPRPVVSFAITMQEETAGTTGQPDPSQYVIKLQIGLEIFQRKLTDMFNNIEITDAGAGAWTITGSDWALQYSLYKITVLNTPFPNTEQNEDGEPELQTFPLANIDQMRMNILAAVNTDTAYSITESTIAPYGLGLGKGTLGEYATKNQEGLGIKTYQSDLFNNWISTEWIDGDNGINAITAIDTTAGEFTLDTLNLANKVYNMLNRIAISGGSYDDWLNAVYTHERAKSVENPVYHGSLIKELAFEEVVSSTDTEVENNQSPLGTLAGRGRLTEKQRRNNQNKNQ